MVTAESPEGREASNFACQLTVSVLSSKDGSAVTLASTTQDVLDKYSSWFTTRVAHELQTNIPHIEENIFAGKQGNHLKMLIPSHDKFSGREVIIQTATSGQKGYEIAVTCSGESVGKYDKEIADSLSSFKLSQ